MDLEKITEDYFENNKETLGDLVKKTNIITVDFSKLSAFSTELSEELINQPTQTIELLENTLNKLIWTKEQNRVRLINVPLTQQISIRNLRVKHLNKLICIDGMIRRVSEVRPKSIKKTFECQCGTIISIQQNENEEKKPSRCTCGKKGGFTEIAEDLIDTQIIAIEENTEDTLDVGTQPKRINVNLAEDLVEPKMEQRINPGSRVKIIGVLKEVKMKSGHKHSTRYDIIIEANNIIPLEEDINDSTLTEEEESKIKEISQRPDLIEYLSNSIVPSICGHEEVKKALTLQLFGGVNHKRTDGSKCRSQIHGFLVGDPSCVDKDTEFFNGKKWKKMNEYKEGDYVMQYNKDKSAEMVKPLRYIVNREDEMYHIKTKYGVDQVLTKNHKFVYQTPKVTDLKECEFSEVLKKHNEQVTGFRGLIRTTFTPKIKTFFDLTDEEIIVQVAFHADGNISSKNVGRINLKKECKKIRLRKILSNANIQYREKKQETGYSFFYFAPPIMSKTYGEDWYSCSLNQMKIISSEVVIWDGNRENTYRTSIKKDADFIQYVFSSMGFRTSITTADRIMVYKGLKKRCILHTILRTKCNLLGISCRGRVGEKERIIKKIKSVDGYSYCFQVPSGMLVLRRNNNIFITGNCGKSIILKSVQKLSHKTMYVSGKSVSGCGITGTVVYDENINSWVLEPGAVVLTNNGMVCIDSEQLVPTITGIKKMKNIVVGDKIINFENGYNESLVKKVINNGIKKTLKIELHDGNELICTPDHKILTQRGWIEAKNMTQNDFIKIPIKTQLPKMEDKNKFELGFINGFAICDMVITRKGVGFSASLKNKIRSDYILNLLKKHFDANHYRTTFPAVTHIINKRPAHFSAVEIINVPKIIMKEYIKKYFYNYEIDNSDSFKLGLLSGILSTDTCISHKKGKYGIKHEIAISLGRVKYSQEKLKIHIRQICSIFNSYGVMTTIRKSQSGSEVIIISSQKSYNQVAKIFSNLLVGKNKNKLYICKKKRNIRSYDDILDDDYNMWYKGLKFKTTNFLKHNISSRIYWMRDNGVTGAFAKKLKTIWRDICDSKFKEPNKNYLLNKIVSINKYKERSVYDLTIDGEPNFLVCGGIVHNCIDEFDKMGKGDRSNLHETMEQGTVTISKATIQTTLSAKTSILAAANPKFSRFEEDRSIASQIDLPSSLLSRFDFIFVLRDIPEESQDNEIADKIINEHGGTHSKEILEVNLFKKYIIYAKKLKPKLTTESINRLKEYYVNLRKRSKSINGKKVIPLGARQLEGLIRLSEASAKIRLQSTVTLENTNEAINVMESYLKHVGYDSEHKTFDIDKVGGNSTSHRSKIDLTLKTIKSLQLMGDVKIETLKTQLNFSQDEFDEIIEKIVRTGEAFKPNRELIKTINI